MKRELQPHQGEISISIQANFGSKFQEQFAKRSLDQILASWKDFTESKHAKNDISFQIKYK